MQRIDHLLPWASLGSERRLSACAGNYPAPPQSEPIQPLHQSAGTIPVPAFFCPTP